MIYNMKSSTHKTRVLALEGRHTGSGEIAVITERLNKY
jgi:hypothetical protein